jgi:hypothetical protein
MPFDISVTKAAHEDGVSLSTMMKTPCLRYEGEFMTMMFEQENALIIKVSPKRVDELISTGIGREFNFTKKRFKEWILISLESESEYEALIYESLDYAKKKKK